MFRNFQAFIKKRGVVRCPGRSIFLLLLLIFCILPPVLALDIPKRPDGYVTDSAGLLSGAAKEKLENVLHSYELKTTNQVVVATFPGLGGESLEDFSIRLAETWKIGQKGRDNGILFLIFKNDRKMRIEVGYGLEGVLPDALAGRIISEIVAPYFRRGEYETGILAGVQAILQAAAGEFRSNSDQGLTQSELEALKAQRKILFCGVLAVIAIISLVDFSRYQGYRWGHQNYPHRYDFLEWWFRFAVLCFLLNFIFQMLFRLAVYSRGNYYGNRSGWGGGGLGGFSGGGGGFGGGGASGSW